MQWRDVEDFLNPVSGIGFASIGLHIKEEEDSLERLSKCIDAFIKSESRHWIDCEDVCKLKFVLLDDVIKTFNTEMFNGTE